jgi:23S rRNA (pseudouridine1915-N3)-methyltransferase
MRVTVVVVGAARGPVAPLVADYEERARRYWTLRVLEVDPGGGRSDRPEDVKEAEGARILARVPEGSSAVALTRRGKGMTSGGLARRLSGSALEATDVTFIIGGAWGLSPSVLERASLHLSLSPMTLPHEMARAFLMEQLYRAGTILRGEPYHKGG